MPIYITDAEFHISEIEPMSKIAQEMALRGSQLWLQQIVSCNAERLNKIIRKRLHLEKNIGITWLSPRPGDNYAEYRDEDFIVLLDIELKFPLESFWPERGPVWDGLAKTSDGKILLVEAKAHARELKSCIKAKAPSSCALINKSLGEAKDFFHASPMADWTEPYYQYANRLAHLYFLREKNGIDAYLLFLYFMNDIAMNGPRSQSEWESIIDEVHEHLDVAREQLGERVIDIYTDVSKLI